MSSECLFCKIAAKKIPGKIVFEDERMLAFEDIAPVAPTHLLLIPREHFSSTLEVDASRHAIVGQLVELGARLARERGFAENGYRLYGPAEISRLRVIRMLIRTGYSLMAILRMLTQLDRGEPVDVRQALDTPHPDEDVFMASDRWLSTLANEAQKAQTMIAMIEGVIQNSEMQNH